MNKRNSILETVRESNSKVDKTSQEYGRLLVVKEVIVRYLEIYDVDNGTIHSEVFSMLYLDKKLYTYKAICDKLHIGKNTLIRYIDKYEKLALNIMKKLNL